MRSRMLGVCLLTVTTAPLAAQTSPTLERLAFLSGCWQGAFTGRDGAGTIEERYTPPSSNVMLGTTRYTLAGRTAGHAFSLIRRDSAGITLIPYPDGERSSHVFRLRLAGDTAWFEAPAAGYPRRIGYRRAVDGSLVARTDSGAADAGPREWRMAAVACNPPLTTAAAPLDTREPTTGPVAPDRSGRVLLYVTQTLNGF